MSLYHKNLKREILYYKDLIRRNNKEIRITKYALFAYNLNIEPSQNELIHRYTLESHQKRLISLTHYSIRLKGILNRKIRLVH